MSAATARKAAALPAIGITSSVREMTGPRLRLKKRLPQSGLKMSGHSHWRWIKPVVEQTAWAEGGGDGGEGKRSPDA